jgi:hypothetical protein
VDAGSAAGRKKPCGGPGTGRTSWFEMGQEGPAEVRQSSQARTWQRLPPHAEMKRRLQLGLLSFSSIHLVSDSS